MMSDNSRIKKLELNWNHQTGSCSIFGDIWHNFAPLTNNNNNNHDSADIWGKRELEKQTAILGLLCYIIHYLTVL